MSPEPKAGATILRSTSAAVVVRLSKTLNTKAFIKCLLNFVYDVCESDCGTQDYLQFIFAFGLQLSDKVFVEFRRGLVQFRCSYWFGLDLGLRLI